MIYIAKQGVKESDFVGLLEKSKKLILFFLDGKRVVSSSDFEKIVYEKMCEAAKSTSFDGTVVQTGTYAFPDIIANKYFGAEVKMTEKDHWVSTGNSVLESSRIEDVERIYIVFGKLGGEADVKYRLYQECLPEVSVTHSPRYRIDMNLDAGKSIFDKMGIDYDVLRKDRDAIKKIKNYYRKQLGEGEELWWIDKDAEEKSISPVIRQFRSLSAAEKEDFLVEAMILFPEIFGAKLTKFEGPAAYLIAEHNAVCPNMRDPFTAGGKFSVRIGGRKKELPQLAKKLYVLAKKIKEKIKLMDEEDLVYYWKAKKIEKDKIGQWKKIVDVNFSSVNKKVLASRIFDEGLK